MHSSIKRTRCSYNIARSGDLFDGHVIIDYYLRALHARSLMSRLDLGYGWLALLVESEVYAACKYY